MHLGPSGPINRTERATRKLRAKEKREMKKIGLGIIGTGIAFQELHAPVLLELHDRFEIIALSSRTESRARQVAAWIAERTGRAPDVHADLDDLLDRDDIDAVDVAE